MPSANTASWGCHLCGFDSVLLEALEGSAALSPTLPLGSHPLLPPLCLSLPRSLFLQIPISRAQLLRAFFSLSAG